MPYWCTSSTKRLAPAHGLNPAERLGRGSFVRIDGYVAAGQDISGRADPPE